LYNISLEEIKDRVFIPIKTRERKHFIRRFNKSLIVKLVYTRMKLDFLLPVPDSRWLEFVDTMVTIRNKIEETGVNIKDYKKDYCGNINKKCRQYMRMYKTNLSIIKDLDFTDLHTETLLKEDCKWKTEVYS
jgi:hypothetical protein